MRKSVRGARYWSWMFWSLKGWVWSASRTFGERVLGSCYGALDWLPCVVVYILFIEYAYIPLGFNRGSMLHFPLEEDSSAGHQVSRFMADNASS